MKEWGWRMQTVTRKGTQAEWQGWLSLTRQNQIWPASGLGSNSALTGLWLCGLGLEEKRF